MYNSKISLAKAKGIPVRADAHIPVKLSISDLDLCVILGNLFDNAIEASQQLPEGERMIRIYMDMKGSQLYISFTNLAPGGKREKVGGRFSSTKGEGQCAPCGPTSGPTTTGRRAPPWARR